MCVLHGESLKSPCTLCVAAAYCCGAVALCVTAALLGRFLPRLGPLLHQKRPFFLSASVFSLARITMRSENAFAPIARRTIVQRKSFSSIPPRPGTGRDRRT